MNAKVPKIAVCRYLGNVPALKTPAYVVIGQDGGQSVSVDDNRVLFFFSDTLLVCDDSQVAAAHATAPPLPVPSLPRAVFLANCAAISEGPDLATLLSKLRYFHDSDGLPREILKPTERERFRNLRFWPEHGICVNGEVYFFYLGIQTVDASSSWGFRNLGVGLAALNVESGECRRVQYRQDWMFWRNVEADLHIGVQVLRAGEFVYVFGSRRSQIENEAFIARVPLELISDREAYEYLTSPTPSWSREFGLACSLGPCSSEYSVSYNAYLEQYTMIYVEEHRKRLMLRVANQPWGPYSDPIDLIGLPHKKSSELIYLGFEHAKFQQQEGRKIFVSYCEPDFSLASLVTVSFDRQDQSRLPAGSAVQRTRRRIETIAGLACTGHGASLAILTMDGRVRSSVLDRWAGIKHLIMFSKKEDAAIRNPQNLTDKQINYNLSYGYGKFPPTRIFEDTIVEWFDWLARDLHIRRSDIDLVVTSECHFATCDSRLGFALRRWFPNAYASSRIEHHQIHQRQAFWQSGLEEAAVLTLDAAGEELKRLGGRALAGTISSMNASGSCQVMSEILFPESSPGVLYEAASLHLGFPMGEEGKTMGLAPYGGAELLERLLPMLRLQEDGSFSFMPHSEFQRSLEEYVAPRPSGGEITEQHKNVAYAAQALLEKIVTNAFAAALRLTRKRKLAYAGGVALNCVANDMAFRAVRPDFLYVPPNPGDTGHALGCALFGAYELARWRPAQLEVPDYIGPSYSEDEMGEAARACGYPIHQPADMEAELARCIANGYITARFAGGAEFGPRALGNRSILCDPRRADMKDYLNYRVKHRESFRPFAPSVLEENAPEWFDLNERSAFMLRAVPVRRPVQERIPAVVHVDGSCRVQTVSRTENPGFYKLIREFAALTDVPIVLNTSFNVAGKPIVETPADAVLCFQNTNIDVLAIGPVLVSKSEFKNYSVRRVDA